jgi:hypothetical protein
MPNSRISSRLLLALSFSLIHMKSSWSWIEPAALMGKSGTADFPLVSSIWLTTASSYRVSKLCHGGHIDAIS